MTEKINKTKTIKIHLKCHDVKMSDLIPLAPYLSVRDFLDKFKKVSAHYPENYKGKILDVKVVIDKKRNFEIEVRSVLTTNLLFDAAGIKKGKSAHGDKSVGEITVSQLREIAELKLKDKVLNTNDIKIAMKSIAATAKGIGIEIKKEVDNEKLKK